MPNDIEQLHVGRVSLVRRASVRDPVRKAEPMRFLLFKAEDGKPVFDPETDNSPETDTDHDFWNEAGQPIPAAWKAVGRTPPTLQKREFDKGVGGGVDRDKLDASDFADPENRKYPIVTPQDVEDAYRLAPKGSPIRDRIVAIAKRKGAAFVAKLPDTAKQQYGIKKADTGDIEMADETQSSQGEQSVESVAKAEEDAKVQLRKAQEDIAAANARADEAEKIAKHERDVRLEREFLQKAEELTHLPMGNVPEPLLKAEDGSARSSQSVLAGALREMSEKAPGAAAVIEPILKQANTLIKSGELLSERGSGTSATPGSAHGKLNALAESIQKSEAGPDGKPLTPEQAYVRALSTPEGRRLYEETRAVARGDHYALSR